MSAPLHLGLTLLLCLVPMKSSSVPIPPTNLLTIWQVYSVYRLLSVYWQLDYFCYLQLYFFTLWMLSFVRRAVIKMNTSLSDRIELHYLLPLLLQTLPSAKPGFHSRHCSSGKPPLSDSWSSDKHLKVSLNSILYMVTNKFSPCLKSNGTIQHIRSWNWKLHWCCPWMEFPDQTKHLSWRTPFNCFRPQLISSVKEFISLFFFPLSYNLIPRFECYLVI